MEFSSTEINPLQPAKRRLIFRNLTGDQKQKLLTGGAGALGAFAGVGIFELLGTSLASSENIAKAEPPVNEEILHSEPVIVYTEAPFAGSVNDDMSFSEAFATAREEIGPGGFFEWKGHTYNTYYREEWEQMDDVAQEDFMTSVYDSTDFEAVAEAGVAYTPVSGPNVEVDAGDKVNESDQTEPEIEAIPLDRDGDGYIDAEVIDLDGDGMIEVISLDQDFDGRADSYIVDLDDDDILESVIVDEDQDGLQGDEIVVPLEKSGSLAIDDFKENLPDDDEYLASDDIDDLELPDDAPDDLMMI